MKDITNFCYSSDIKPIFQKVYVYEKGEDKFAVATDTFRLVEWKIEDPFLKENILNGYYEKKIWKDLCKCYNKSKRDLKLFEEFINKNISINENFKEDFPDYYKILPKELYEFDRSMNFNLDYFIDFLKMIPEKRFKKVSLRDIRCSDKAMWYEDPQLKIILMALND